MKKVASSRQLLSKLARKTKMPSSTKLPVKSFRVKRESRTTESPFLDEEIEENIADQQYDMFRDMFINGHDPRVIAHTMHSAGLDPSVVVPPEALSNRGGARTQRHENIRRNKYKKSTHKDEVMNSRSYSESPRQGRHSALENKNQEVPTFRHNNSFSVDDRAASFSEMSIHAPAFVPKGYKRQDSYSNVPRNSFQKTYQRKKDLQKNSVTGNENMSVYSNDGGTAFTSSRRNRNVGLDQGKPPTNGLINQTYKPGPRSVVSSSTSEKVRRTFIRRNNRQGNQGTSNNGTENNNSMPRSSVPKGLSHRDTSTSNTGSLTSTRPRSERPTRIGTSVPLVPEHKKNGVPLQMFPYDSEVYKPFKVMQILRMYPTQIIEALENAGLDPCILYKGVDVNRHPDEPVKLVGAQSDKWELKYSKRYFLHYYENISTGEILWKDEVDEISQKLTNNSSKQDTFSPHDITDDDI